MGCTNGKKNKLESFTRATEGQGGGALGAEVKNRYIVGIEEEEGNGPDQSTSPPGGNNDDELAMYTNISDFKAEKIRRREGKKRTTSMILSMISDQE